MSRLWPSHYTPPGRASPALEIIAMVAREFGVSPNVIKSASRNGNLTVARAIIADALIRRGCSFAMAGRLLQRDHTTIMHSQRMLPVYMARNPDLAPLHDRAVGAAARETVSC